MIDECPDPKCKLELIKCLNTKVSKGYLGTTVAVIVTALGIIAMLVYGAYDSRQVAKAEEIKRIEQKVEKHREKLADCKTNTKLITQSLETIKEDLKEFKHEQRKVNSEVLKSLEELKSK